MSYEILYPSDIPDEERCPTNLVHEDKSKARCILDKDHVLNDSYHIDEHGHRAKPLVSQATIREVEHWFKTPLPHENRNGQMADTSLLANAWTLRLAASAITMNWSHEPMTPTARLVRQLHSRARLLEDRYDQQKAGEAE